MALNLPNYIGTVVSSGGTPSTEVQKILVVGQKEASGTAVAGDLYQNLEDVNQIDTLFGLKSDVTATLRGMLAIKRQVGSPVNPQIDVIALDDAGGAVAASATVTFTGAATADGKYFVSIASALNHTYEIDVLNTDTGATIADKLETLINADDRVPVTVANDTLGTLTLTAVNAGEIGNDMLLELTGSIAGVTPSLTAFSSGVTNPSTTGIFSVVDNIRYQTATAPSEYGRQYLEDFLEPRFNTNTSILLDGVAFLTNTDTFANLITLVNPVSGLNNSRVLVTFANRLKNEDLYKGGSLRELNHVISGQAAFLRALRLTNGAFLQDILSTVAASTLDNRGGPALASLPYFNTRGFILPLIDLQDEWTPQEKTEAQAAGLSIIGNSQSRSFVQFGNVLTAYKKDTQGNDDNAFKFLNFVDTYSTIREEFKIQLQAAFPQSRLVLGGNTTVQGRNFVTSLVLSAKLQEIYADLASSDFALTDNTIESLRTFKQSLQIDINKRERKASITMRVPIVSQLETFDILFITDVN